ncbi:MAG: hypothetical protein JST93_36605 [Acidobacteria bacterium]|nr:hypothetical protein [Acidobacteriota bacterium]
MAAKAKPSTRVKTLEQARAFVLRVKTCLIFGSAKSDLPSLWDVVDLPDRQPGKKGWGEKITAIWTWKNQLPAECPDEIFYGKLPGGLAVLMEMEHLRSVHYPQHHRDLKECSELAQRIYQRLRLQPLTTTQLRKELSAARPLTKSMVDRALVELQVTLNIARLNAPEIERDTWVRFTEQYPEFG